MSRAFDAVLLVAIIAALIVFTILLMCDELKPAKRKRK